MAVPFTGLGLYNGFRGNRWLKNRIKIFKQFVIPSLRNQTNNNFVLWCSWRHEEKNNPLVRELIQYLDQIKEFKTVHTFHGICFYDDKYDEREARSRLLESLRGSIGELLDTIGEVDYVYMTIQPSDDCYSEGVVSGIQKVFEESDVQAFGFDRGYIINYLTKQVKEYNPETNPPFYTIKFPRDVFADPLKHADFTSLKRDVGGYKAGTPIPSHEYVKDALKYGTVRAREFMVGCHLDNTSTVFDHPYAGDDVDPMILSKFGLSAAENLIIPFSFGKYVLNRLPYGAKRKLRYWSGERKWIMRPFFAAVYNFLRS